MNNRYLYRAKRTDNGEWVEGYYAVARDRKGLTQHNILSADNDLGYFKWIVVDQSTICQCTGLKKLFEKDIVKRTDIHKVGEPSIGIIEYDVENTAFVIRWIDKEKYSPMYPWKDKIKVICNIFDNPELLEVEE